MLTGLFKTEGRAGKPIAALCSTVLTNVVTLAFNVTASVIAARMLGPVKRGAFSAVQLWPIVAVGLGTLGLPRAAAYYLGRRGESRESVIASTAAALLAAASASACVLFLFMPRLLGSQPGPVVSYARCCLVLLPLLYLGMIPNQVLQGLNRLRTWNLVRLQLPVLWLAMHVAGCLLRRSDLGFYAWGYIAVMALHNATWLIVFAREFPFRGGVRTTVLRRLFGYGLPLTMGSLPQYLNLRLDQVLMAVLVPPRVLGLYVTAVAWSAIVLPVLSALSQVSFPWILGLNDHARQHELLGRSFRLSTICAVLCSGMLILVTPRAIPLIYGRAFAEASLPACILAIGSVFLAVNGVLSEGLRALGLPQYPMYAELVGFGVTVALLLMLLPRWPLLGASIASAISYGVTSLVLIFSAAQTAGTPVWRLVFPRRSDIGILRRVLQEARQ